MEPKNKKYKSYITIINLLLRFVLCIFLTFIFFKPSCIYAKEDNDNVVRIAWFISDLFQEGGEGEAKSGYAYDYLRKLTDYTDWEYEYVYGEWSELYEMLCNGEVDFMAGMSKTDERKQLMLFASSAMETDEYYLYKRIDDSTIKASDLSSFKGKKIGLLYNNRISDFTLDWINENNVDVEAVYFDSFDVLHAAFENGEIDLEPRTKDGGSDNAGISALVNLGEEPSYLAVNKNRPDLLDELNEALNYLDSVDHYALQRMQSNNYGATYTNRTLTNIEETWLNENTTLRVGYLDDYLPYCDADENGDATGLMVDVLNGIFESLEISKPNIEYFVYEDHKDLVDGLHNNEIDLAFPMSSDAYHLEEDDISASNEVITDRGAYFYKATYDKNNVKTIAVKENNQFQNEYAKLYYPNAKLVTYPTIDDCLNAVLKGEVDGTVMDALRIQYVTGQSKYENLSYIQLDNATGKSFGIVRGNTGLLMLVNRGLKILGTTYGYDNSYKYLESFQIYTTSDFIKDHLLSISIIFACFISLVIVLMIFYIKKQRKQLHIQEALKQEAEKANEAKSTFLFNMSHDIRTPMNAVLGFNELMLENIDDKDKVRTYIEKIRFSGEYLLGLINNVLEVARIDSGHEVLNEEFADFEDDSYYSVFENDAKNKKLEIIRNVDITHRYVYADAQKIREILLNLISNAIKYTPAGGTIHIDLKEKPCDKKGYATYVCDIADNGIGMSKKFQKQVYESFAREHNSTESKVMGTGLGMSIVKKLVDLMGGTITVDSELGKGTTFTVTMDLKIVEDPEKYLNKQKQENSYEGLRLDNRRILLAEDNELNAEIAATILENCGASVELAKDGVECFEMLENHEDGYYDLILMDIQMPNLDGYDATKKIRALSNPSKANIPIIAMTANAFDEDKKAALAAGMNDHIAKPVDAKKAIQVIISVLEDNNK